MNKAQKILFTSIGWLLFVAILSFSFYHYTRYKKGPEIISINVQKYMSTKKPSIKMSGKIVNTKSVKINGRNIILEQKKNFNELIVFSSGNNIIEVLLKDSFGKTKLYTYHIYFDNEQDYIKTHTEALKQKESLLTEEAKA